MGGVVRIVRRAELLVPIRHGLELDHVVLLHPDLHAQERTAREVLVGICGARCLVGGIEQGTN